MIFNNSYWTKVIRNIIYVFMAVVVVYISFKLSIFYVPFFVAFILSIILEPIIKKIMKKTNLSRRTSSIIIFLVACLIIIGSLTWGIMTIISESSNLLESLNVYIEKIYDLFQGVIKSFNFKKIELPEETINIIENSFEETLKQFVEWLRMKLTQVVEGITHIPTMLIQFVITILALYFMCVDKIYIIDQLEHHMPQLWMKKIQHHFREITKTLGGYLRAQVVLVLVSFVILLIGLYLYKLSGFKIEYPLLMAVVIGFVDALPILGSGAIMIPWAIVCALNGNLKLGISLIILLIIMSITRQVLEPKLVSQNIGIHPIFTLIAMYTGFKLLGVIGMLVGPIVLIILKNIFANLINQGVFKSIFDKK